MSSSFSFILFRFIAIVICAFFSWLFGQSINPTAGWILFVMGISWFFLPPLSEKLSDSLPLLNNLKTVSGVAGNVVNSIENFGVDGSLSTHQVLTFDIDGYQPTTVSLPESIIIFDGDTVIVSGILRRGLLRGLAYRNISRNVFARQPALLYLVFGIAIALFGLSMFSVPNSNTAAYTILLFSTYFFYRWATIRDAYNNVRK